MSRASHNTWLHAFALLTAFATLCLIGIGGLVTSHGVGMAVPDWPTTYGYNMFFFPVSKWIGGIFYEHTHRLMATVVGMLVVALTRWLGGKPARLPLVLIGLAEILSGVLLTRIGTSWHGAGYFLSGIGGVVLLAGLVWWRNEPASGVLPLCGWLAFALVQIQGLLGGLRVVLFKDQIGIFHAGLAQMFFALLCVIVLLTSRWRMNQNAASHGVSQRSIGGLFVITTLLILGQLLLGATMRHQHAGIAIPDFPLAYGKIWPTIDPSSVALYNQHRLETTAANPITPFQIVLQMGHRLLALVILAAVSLCAWKSWTRLGLRSGVTRWSLAWLGMILLQAGLGAFVIWSNKAAEVATAHVVVGALALAAGAMLSAACARIGALSMLPAKSLTSAADLSQGTLLRQPSAASVK